MAYPTIDAPYGLKPVGLVGGRPYTGATRKIPIASNYGTGIFNGDVVQYTSDGTIIITTLQNDTSAVAGVIGVFVGVSYTDPNTNQLTFRQNYPASTVASDIEAFVIDDPDVIFKAVNCTSSSADGATGGLLPLAKTRGTTMACNAELVLNTGLTSTGNSRMGVFINNVTSALPFTVVDVVSDTVNSSGNFTEFHVKFTAGYHRYDHTVGV
jgi:hypothetical protein|tara:strand:+ start:551 stop:1183 length:633 start_codon:yes stop_codon:yes gene_type:complete